MKIEEESCSIPKQDNCLNQSPNRLMNSPKILQSVADSGAVCKLFIWTRCRFDVGKHMSDT